MAAPWRTQIASNVSRDGLGLELIDADYDVSAEVFRCDADHTLTVRVFRALPFVAVEWLVESARERLGPFPDGTPLPPRLAAPVVPTNAESIAVADGGGTTALLGVLAP